LVLAGCVGGEDCILKIVYFVEYKKIIANSRIVQENKIDYNLQVASSLQKIGRKPKLQNNIKYTRE